MVAVSTESPWGRMAVSQVWLAIVLRLVGTYWRLSNQTSGGTEWVTHRQRIDVTLIVLESTGGMERELVQVLQRQGLPVAVIHPKRARDFAKVSGRLAKTDRLDAGV